MLILPFMLSSEEKIHITLGGIEYFYSYTEELLIAILESEGYVVETSYIGHIPTSRIEYMMENGDISCFILGETEARSERFLSVNVNMTDNLMGKRILMIRPEDQHLFDKVQTLEDFRNLALTCGMGSSWGDVPIWEYNGLKVLTIEGDWRKLFNMVASGNRPVDYLSRGALEITVENELFPELTVEKNLVFVYPKDHVLYISPRYPELHRILKKALEKEKSKSLIRSLTRKHFSHVYNDPVSIDLRRVINLELPQ